MFDDTEHVKRVESLAMAALGVIHSASLILHVIGRGLAAAAGLDPKHATKQVDRLIGNDELSLRRLFGPWVRYVVGDRKEVVVALDWTEFDKDSHATLCLYLITRHGRATPLVWKTVLKATLEGKRNGYEDEVIEQLHGLLAEEVRVTLLADRGFGDQLRYQHLSTLGWDYVIRFRECILVTSEAETKPAREWLALSGRAKMLKGAQVTADKTEVPAVVVVHDRRMKDAWCLATSRADIGAADVAKLYGRRFTIEETFRDTKDIHFGMGLSATHVRSAARRDRLLMLAAIAYAMLVLLGAAGERCGLDRSLKVNTRRTRTLSLYNQGKYWYDALPNMDDGKRERLMAGYEATLAEHEVVHAVFGVL
jgi:hypothetical protein